MELSLTAFDIAGKQLIIEQISLVDQFLQLLTLFFMKGLLINEQKQRSFYCTLRSFLVQPATFKVAIDMVNTLLDRVVIWMGDHLDKIPCVVLLGKSGWCSKHQPRLPPLLQMLYVD